VTTTTAPPPAPGTSHSPGPWRVHGQSESGRYITVKAANGRTVARVPWNSENTPLCECTDASDALIISLAPGMLAALEDMVVCFGGHSDALARENLAQAKAIIAKVRGLAKVRGQ